jgi:hypothetical protein
MAETKYGKYIIDTLKPPAVEAPWSPPISEAGKGQGGRVLYMDNDIVPGAFYVECAWVMPRPAGSPPSNILGGSADTDSHSHAYDEVIALFGTDPDNPHDLGAEVELWLGDEKHFINKSSLIYVPAGLKHCPLTFLKVERPVFHFTTGPNKMYF